MRFLPPLLLALALLAPSAAQAVPKPKRPGNSSALLQQQQKNAARHHQLLQQNAKKHQLLQQARRSQAHLLLQARRADRRVAFSRIEAPPPVQIPQRSEPLAPPPAEGLLGEPILPTP